MSKIEPYGYAFQHEETGLEQVVDVQQVEWGFEKNNPRWQKIGPVYPESALTALTEDRDRIERNRDMWKGQVERQAEQIAMMRAALDECEDYFDNRADADCDQDGFIPNEEMKLLHVVRTALERLPAPSSTTGEAA